MYVLEGTLKLLHPFMPFITDEIYRYLPGTEGTIMLVRLARRPTICAPMPTTRPAWRA